MDSVNIERRQRSLDRMFRMIRPNAPGRNILLSNIRSENNSLVRGYKQTRNANMKRSISPGTVRNTIRSLSPKHGRKTNTRKHRRLSRE